MRIVRRIQGWFAQRMLRRRSVSWLAWVLLTICLVASAVTALLVRNAAQADAVRSFDVRATQAGSNVTLALRRLDDLSMAFMATVASQSDGLAESELTHWYARVSAHGRDPGLLGFTYIRYVPAAGLAQFMRKLRSDSSPRRAGGPIQVYPPGRRAAYCLVRTSVAPGLRGAAISNSVPLGGSLDICAVGGGVVLNGARDTGQLTAVVINLAPQGRVLTVSVPVYVGGVVPRTVAERRTRIVGWALAQFSVASVLSGAVDHVSHLALSLSRRDMISSGSVKTVFGPISAVTNVGRATGLPLRHTFTLSADGLWILTVRGAPEWTGIAPDVQGAAIFVTGSLIALLVFAVVLLLGRNRAKSEERLRAIFRHSPAPIFIRDRGSRYIATSKAFDKMLGLEPGAAIGTHASEVLPADMAQTMLSHESRVLAGETVTGEATLTNNGEPRTVSELQFPLVDASGNAYAVCGIVNDVTEKRQMEAELRHLADYDPLTGVYNRAFLISELDRQLRHARRDGRPCAIATFNVDHLKVVNDTNGHAAADAVLKALADLLQARTRETDIVARLGGDEFTVVLPGATQEGASVLARDVRALLADRTTGPPITVSVGIATFPTEGKITANGMLVSADVALYEAKEAGGDQVNTYTASQSATMTWVRRIPAALAEERLVLYGQPIIDLTSGHVVRNELLIRMLSRDGDVIPPGAFLPPAERLGLIGAIDRWVVRAGLRLASEVGGVAINLSGSTIGDQSILAAVREAVAGGLKPDRVMFEITETAATTNLDAARMFTGALNGIGCAVALDDFGTGFGSLTHLKRIPAQYLKIDIEFVRRMTRDVTDRQIVASIVGMAAALNKRTIAEGVQDQETLDLLRELGVDYAQGFFIGKPKRLSAPTAFERERDASPPSTPRRSGWRSRPSPGSRGGTPHRVPDPA